MVKTNANTQPDAATRPMTAQTGVAPDSSMAAMTDDTKMPPKVLNNNKVLRSSQSAIAPERIPRKKKGAILAAAATPTMKGDPVKSKTSHPTATCSMPVLRE